MKINRAKNWTYATRTAGKGSYPKSARLAAQLHTTSAWTNVPHNSEFGNKKTEEMKNMGTLLTIGIVLAALWLLGLISSNTFGGGIYLILVVAVILIVLEILS